MSSNHIKVVLVLVQGTHQEFWILDMESHFLCFFFCIFSIFFVFFLLFFCFFSVITEACEDIAHVSYHAPRSLWSSYVIVSLRNLCNASYNHNDNKVWQENAKESKFTWRYNAIREALRDLTFVIASYNLKVSNENAKESKRMVRVWLLCRL